MAGYEKTEKMINEVVENILKYRDLVGETDASKESTYGFVPGLNMTNEAIALTEQAANLKEGIFQVLFTGGFSSGKSTLLNALMRKNLLKTGINPETAVITKIVFNADEKIIVYKKEIDEKTGKQITEEMSIDSFFEKYRVDQDDPEMFMEIDYVQLQQKQDGIGGSTVQLVDSPGTQNSKADDEVARSFAQKASAIVYLINAVKPFELDEKEYIATHYEDNHMKNLFFIINRFDNVQPGDVPALKENVRQQLKNVFTDENGNFDENLFQNRVFYTNSYGSLCARTGQPMETNYGPVVIEDNNTGVPQFESAMEKYLLDDNRDRDALGAYVPKMATIFVNAEKRIEAQLEAYQNGIDKIKEDREILEASIERVSKTVENIQSDCQTTAQKILNDIKTEYDNYVSDVEQGWDTYFDEHPVSIPITQFIPAMLSKNEAKKQEVMKPVQGEIKKYIESKANILSDGIKDAIKINVDAFEERLALYQEQLESVDCPVDISEIMSKIYSISTNTGEPNVNLKINTFQFILGVAGGDLDIALGGMTGGQTNKEAVVKSITKNVFEFVAIEVVAWPIGLAMLVKRGYDIVKAFQGGGTKAAKEIIVKMKAGTITELKARKDQLSMDMETRLGGAFIRAGALFAEGFNNELDSYRTSYGEMISNLEKEGFDIEQEQKRTDMILVEMERIINNVCRNVLNKEFSVAEIRAKAEKNNDD